MSIQIPELPPLPSDLFDLLGAIRATLQIKLLHEQAMSQTERGRRSGELRTAAQQALFHVPVEQTHAMFREAAALHPPEDVGRAAAAARFDLARSFERQQTGSRLENYLHAEQLYREVLLCPERDEDPLRAALSRDALAVCLRKISEYPVQREARPELMSEALRYSLEAIHLALGAGPLGLMQAAFYLNSLGNHLRQKARQLDEAMVGLQRAEACINQAVAIEAKLLSAMQGPTRQMLSPGDIESIAGFLTILRQERENDSIYGVLYNISGAYVERGRGDDRKRAEKLLLGIIKGQSVTKRVLAQELLANLYLEQNKRDEARNLLRQISWEQVRPSEAENMVRTFERAGLLDEALGLAHHYISKYHQTRMETRADHIADEMASRAHKLGALAARIYAKKEDPAAAFLALETTSGAHFEEQISQFVRPQGKNAVARGLLEIGSVFKAASIIADEMASRFEQVRASDPAEARAGLLQILELHKNKEIPHEHVYYPNEVADKYAQQTFVSLFEKALAAADPVMSLREDSATLQARLVQFANKATPLDPNLTGLFFFPLLSTRELAALLKQYPDTCFIRLSQESDLLVVSVWHEKGRIRGATQRVTLSRKLFTLLDEIRDDPKAGNPKLLRQEIERIDLSAAFPRTKRAVLLPSWAASLLPLAALGPRGNTLLDRYSSLLWLPSLAPLRKRQEPCPPRRGVLSVAPRCANPLLLGKWVFQGALPDERRLLDLEATLSRVRERSRAADVVAFYTHGRHEPGKIEIELSDQPLRAELAWCFRGAERVELWACQTGVNLATDWIDQHGHDQHFGLDIAMLEAGARSAIGSLWAVPELVTACIVRRYRAALRAGEDGAAALCTAQRAFRDELLPQILNVFDSGDAAIWDSVDKYFVKLSGAEEAAGSSLPERALNEEERARLRQSLLSPTAWAGFRFVGVPELRPRAPWDPETVRPLTQYELLEVDTMAKELLAIPPPAQLDPDIDPEEDANTENTAYWLEQETLLRDVWDSSLPVTLEHALKAARLYHDRLHGARSHNLLFGLAWLHEAMTKSSLPTADRVILRLEAAHLWLELAEGEILSAPAVIFSPPASHLLARAEELLKEEPKVNLVGRSLAYQLSHAAARARLSFLSALGGHDFAQRGLDLQSTMAQAARAARTLLEPLLTQPIAPSYEVQRALSIACGILLADAKAHRKALQLLRNQLSKSLPRTAESEHWVSVERLVAWQRLLLAELEPQRAPWHKPGGWDLLPRERFRIALVELRELERYGPLAGDRQKAILSSHLSSLEQAFWGPPSGRLVPFLRSTGTPGEAYRALFGAFLQNPEDGPAVHHIACMQQACDLRTPLLNRLVHAVPWVAKALGVDLLTIWEQVLYRERLVQAWADTVSGPLASAAAAHAAASVEPGQGLLADPFTQDRSALERACASTKLLSEWILYSLFGRPRVAQARQGQTAAFQTASQIAAWSSQIDKLWREALRRSDERAQHVPVELRAHADLAALLDPGVEIKGCEQWLRELPEGCAVLGLMFSSPLSIAGSFTWRTRSAHGEQSTTLEPTMEARAFLVELFRELSDAQEQRGLAGQRADLWPRLTNTLAPFLHRLMHSALATKEPLHLYVLAPGSLRVLPFGGLRAGDRPLLAVFRSITHLPALKFADPLLPVAPAKKTACLFADSAPSDGMLGFGRAAIKTLRAAFPAHAVEPQRAEDLRGPDIIENDAIQALAPDLACLRIYGQGSVLSGAASDAHLLLSHGRVLTGRNIMDPLPACDIVELWAATSGIAPCSYAAFEREDRLPGLVPAFLQCGARGVIDLAWPVFDLVKALVCERYGLLRSRLALSADKALTQALVWTQRLLADWADARAEHIGVRSALAWLDQARRAGAIALGGDPDWVAPYAAQTEHPLIQPLSVDELITEARQPSHLAAFRYWGGISRDQENNVES